MSVLVAILIVVIIILVVVIIEGKSGCGGDEWDRYEDIDMFAQGDVYNIKNYESQGYDICSL